MNNNSEAQTMVQWVRKAILSVILLVFFLSIVQVAIADSGKGGLGVSAKGNVKEKIHLQDGVRAEVDVSVEASAGDSSEAEEIAENETVERDDEDEQDSGESAEVKTEVKEGKEKTRVKSKLKVERRGKAVERAREEVELVKARLKQLRQDYYAAKERYQETRERYQEERSDLLELKEDIKKCDAEDGEKCKSRKDTLKRGVKQHLLKTIELMERSLDRLTSRVQDQPTLIEEEKEKALSLIAEAEVGLTAKRGEVEALAENATAEQLRSAIKDLKKTWQDVRKVQKRIIASLISAKMDVLVEKHDEYANAMQLRIDELEKTGADVSELKALLFEFQQSVVQLKEDHVVVDELWIELGRGRDVLDQWHEAQIRVREDLHETRSILARFLTKYKGMKKELKEKAEEAGEEGENDSEEAEDQDEEEAGEPVEQESEESSNETATPGTSTGGNATAEAIVGASS